ncbi:MAG: hypothetical protein A2X94_04625 [Bdellovibrionales bacterium GWB1_55_8]|nr:MAG: hypothetical protein A2X94_04625 [Bdellovibrionales bacterium GWB1_55_8]
MAFDETRYRKLLSFAIKNKASDIHLRAGEPPVFRIKNDLVAVKMEAVQAQDIQEFVRSIIGDKLKDGVIDNQEQDFSFDFAGIARFRGNAFRQDGNLAVVLRIIPHRVPSVDELGLPSILKKIVENERGLALVTGATGSGKSTTLAAMIEHLNETRAIHIVTVEDPVEFVHSKRKAQITRREVGRDTLTFASALRAVLRQDPDVILIGELRDRESIDIALKAAETGHLVLSTVHTTDAPKTIAKLVSMFPGEEQQAARRRIADNLVATVGQRLLKRNDQQGLVCVQEIMINNVSIQDCIIDDAKVSEMVKYIENGFGLNGSQSFDQHLLQLYKAGVISLETAKENSPSGDDFEKALVYDDSGDANPQDWTSVGRPDAEPAQEATPTPSATVSRVELDMKATEAAEAAKARLARKPKFTEQKAGFVADGFARLKKLAGTE